MIGTSLGPYKIIEKLGAGGMGEVYLGEDTRLGRKVAIKVLPEEYASDPERLARFEQEARAAAALNHPHIAVVHHIGTEGDIHFMVQEYLEGQSLRERLDKGALPLDKALNLATEVGEALIAAHKAGIIHRDLKPDNIFVTEEGHAKVLDFGLAKLTEMAAPTGSSASMSPTMLGTVAGQVMGTVGYMAPEQINGEEIDQRADLFAFGAVFYEMVTGRRAFAGDNIHETLSRIISKQPQAVHEIRDDLPLKLGWIIDKALAKEPGRRYQTATGFSADLAQLQDDITAGVAVAVGMGIAPAVSEATKAPPGISRKVAAPALVAALVLGGAATWWATRSEPPVPEPPVRFEIELPPETRLTGTGRLVVAISPDGTRVVFTANEQLYLHRMDEGVTAPMRNTAGARSPFFSPDGEWLGFYSGGQLNRMPINGGATVSLGRASNPWGASWAEDGTIFFGWGPRGIWSISAEGGEPEIVVAVGDDESAHGPHLLPGGEWLLFTLRTGAGDWGDSQIVAQSMISDDRKQLVPAGTGGRYVPTGHIVYWHDGNLLAVPIDAERVEVLGGPVSVVEGVSAALSGRTGAAHYGFSEGGALVYLSGDLGSGYSRPAWVSRDGTQIEPLEEGFRLNAHHPALSPDGRRLALTIDADLWVFDLEGRPPRKLTFTADTNNPLWTPDGSRLVYERTAGEMFAIVADGTSQLPEPVRPMEGHNHPLSWTPDGRLVFVEIEDDGAGGDLWAAPLDGQGEAQPLVQTPQSEGNFGATISPDGRWLAYQSTTTGADEVWVKEYPDGAPLRVSTDGGRFPVWSRDGEELYYLNGDKMMAVAISAGPEQLSFDPPETLFEANYGTDAQPPAYDVAADGRFLMLEQQETAATRQGINVVLNWFEELKERVPTGGR